MHKQNSITILLVDDHAIVREGYRSLLEKQPDLLVIAEAVDGEQAYEQFKKYQPDITIMDLSLPGQGGLETITRIRARDAYAKILVFTMHLNPRLVIKSTQAGALGYITKSSSAGVLLRAIKDVYAGRHTLSADVAQILALEKTGYQSLALETLTVREFEILRMLVEARSTGDIASILNISPKTVSNCHSLIKRKLNVDSDIELMHFSIKMDVISLLELSGG